MRGEGAGEVGLAATHEGGAPGEGVLRYVLRYGPCPTQDAEQGEDGPGGAERSPVERALVDLGIEWKDVMAFGVHSARVAIIEKPVGFKRTWWFPEARAEAKAEG